MLTPVGIDLTVPGVIFVSPVSGTGTRSLSMALNTVAANKVLAGPASGADAAWTARLLVAADIPSLPASQITSGQLAVARGGTGLDGSAAANGRLLIGNGSGFTLASLTAGANITITPAAGAITIAASGGGGVDSVAYSMLGGL